jgi:phage tail-like protein
MPLVPSNAKSTTAFTADVLGRTLGAFSGVRGLEAEVEVLEYREGGMNDIVHRLPGPVRYPNLVLTGGLTSTAVEEWFDLTRLGATRHTLTVTMYDDSGDKVRAWSFADAFPVRWTGPVLSTGEGAAAAEELEIVHGGMTLQP